MPDQAKPNVFAPEFLRQAFAREPPPVTAFEARWAGPWRIEPQGGSYFVVRESGGEPVAVTERRETALLLAAVLPVTGRDPLYHLEPETEREVALKAVQGDRGLATVGRLRSIHEGLAGPLSVAEYLLRSPVALAFLLEAASFEALEQAGAVLARRMAERWTPDPEVDRPEEYQR